MTAPRIARPATGYVRARDGAAAEVGRFLDMLRAPAGEEQALAGISGLGQAELVGLVTAALWQLQRDAGDIQAGDGSESGILLAFLRATTCEDGEEQALAGLCALLSGLGQAHLAELFIAVLRQLASLGRQ